MVTYDRSLWTRRKMNHRLFILTTLPLHIAKQTNDPWIRNAQGCLIYVNNPVWLAAMNETARLTDLYERKIPLARWGIEVPPPNDPFWGYGGDPASRRRARITRRLIDQITVENEILHADLPGSDAFSLDAGQVELDAWSTFVEEMRATKRYQATPRVNPALVNKFPEAF